MILQTVLILVSAPVLLAAVYLAVLAAAAHRQRPPRAASRLLRFDLVIPAHNEEADIVRAVCSLDAVDYPRALRRIVVVADNCTDQTPALARAAGAMVIERKDPRPLGKGGALADAFAYSLSDGFADALVVTDADTIVSTNLLSSFAARIERGAEVVQADYAVSNPEASWRTELTALGFALFHRVRSLAREALKLSSGLRGNGMCFTAQALRRVPYRAFSRVEDVEYGVDLGEAGIRVEYAAEATVWGDMPADAAAAATQRLRWELGRRELARARAVNLFVQGLRRHDLVLMDLAMDLWIPSLARLTALALGGTAIVAALGLEGAGWPPLTPWLTTDALLAFYVARGWHFSGTGRHGLAVMLGVPRYLWWKAVLGLRRSTRGRTDWIRTAREGR
jgi:1,2-diacylglycerol 3-beta-glucosyltransferase